MKKTRKHTSIPVLILFLLLIGQTTRAQQSNTFYLMHQVPQSNLLNPAVQIDCKWYIGVPVLASTHISYSNTAFTYRDLAGSDTWNLYGVLDQMHRVDLVATEAQMQLISLGYKRRSYYFTFNVSERSNYYQTVPRDLVETIARGNGPFIGNTAKYFAFRPTGYYNRQYSLGVSKVFSSSLTAGVRANLLFGKANVSTGRSTMQMSTAENNFDILVEGDYVLNSNFPMTITTDDDGRIEDIIIDEIDPREFLLNRKNPGFSVDMGVVYKYNQRVTLSASLLDLGLVHWKSDPNNITASGTFAFTGVDPDSEIISGEFLSEMLDSILEVFNPTPTEDPYYAFLPAQLFLAGTYQATDRITLGAVNRNVFFRSKIHSSLTLLAQSNVGNNLQATVSWSYLNNSLKNIGLGLAYIGPGFQLHAVSDNLLGFLYPFDTRTMNLRFGFNLMLGCRNKNNGSSQGNAYGPMPTVNNCSPARSNKKREKQMQRAARNQLKGK